MVERFRRRDLPHWDVAHATYFVTACLAGSMPAMGLLSIRAQRRQPARRRPPGLSDQSWNQRCAAIAFAECDKVLDLTPRVRWLADRRLAVIVRDSLLYGHGTQYDLLAYVVMPSHFHCVFTPCAAWVSRLGERESETSSRTAIMRSIKRHTARECNRVIGRSGAFWQAESYDRVLRNDQEVERACRYVEYNPVKAGLCGQAEEWEFSSARRLPGDGETGRERRGVGAGG